MTHSSLTTDAPTPERGQLHLVVSAAPGEGVFLLISGQTDPNYFPAWVGSLVSPTIVFPLFVDVVPSGGTLKLSLPIPGLAPSGREFLTLFAQT